MKSSTFLTLVLLSAPMFGQQASVSKAQISIPADPVHQKSLDAYLGSLDLSDNVPGCPILAL